MKSLICLHWSSFMCKWRKKNSFARHNSAREAWYTHFLAHAWLSVLFELGGSLWISLCMSWPRWNSCHDVPYKSITAHKSKCNDCTLIKPNRPCLKTLRLAYAFFDRCAAVHPSFLTTVAKIHLINLSGHARSKVYNFGQTAIFFMLDSDAHAAKRSPLLQGDVN